MKIQKISFHGKGDDLLDVVWFGKSAFVCLKEMLLAGAQVPEDNAQVSQVQREGVVVGLHNLHGAVYRSNHRIILILKLVYIFLDLRKNKSSSSKKVHSHSDNGYQPAKKPIWKEMKYIFFF